MKIHQLVWAILAALTCLAPAQTRAADGNRFLLIFETTRGMKRDMTAARQCAQDLLAGKLDGQALSGDTLGVWTYDSDLHAGNFQMQEFSTDNAADIAQHLDDFLKQQRCKDDARFDKVLAELNRVVTGSGSITVLIFSDGFDPLQGTPFDSSVNEIYAQHRDELHDARIPFVTLLQARGGKIVRATVNSAVGPIEIPALPPPPAPPKPVESPAPAPVVTPPPVVAVKTNAPLILDYSRSNTVVRSSTKTSNNAPAPTPSALANAFSAITNIMSLAPSSAAPAKPVTTATASSPTTVSQPAVTATAETAPPPVVAAAALPEKPPGHGGVLLAVLGLLLALAGLVAVYFLGRRNAPRASAITESFDRTKK